MPTARLRRVLVANRGEIARRVIRGAHDVGMEAVAVFAADDAGAPHVKEADLAVRLAGTGLAETYLSAAALVDAALRSGADCLHPGYGFLSENPALPDACRSRGVVWVGPPPEAMRVMGHKARAKETVADAGVPVLKSVVLKSGMDDHEVVAKAEEVGFPLLVKASAGGGGRGMRLVPDRADTLDAVGAAQREAMAAFGSDEVFLERYLQSPRHVEVQVIGDSHGTVLHLFDRECSVQRRHQKVIEEAPAVLVARPTRQAMWAAAIAAAESVGYRGVGTVEFLVDGEEFYFLEMNTRLQVEHGVTELVTGLDLVALQFVVASGAPLPMTQDQVSASGHAVEARLCAERPQEDYRPTPGTVRHVRWPHGEGVRVDAAVEDGSTVSPAYDSLVAKVMAHGTDRASALSRLVRALQALELDGLETNRSLLEAVLVDDVFWRGEAGVDYLDARADLRDAGLAPEVRERHAAAACFALLWARSAASLVPVPAPGWRNVGTALHRDVLTDKDGAIVCRISTPAAPAEIQHGDSWTPVGTAVVAGDSVELTSDGIRRHYRVRLTAHSADVNGPEGQSSFALRAEDDPDDQLATADECRAPLPGAVTRVLVTAGDVVADGDGLVVLEAMKMEHTLRAAGPGVVERVLCAPGQQVDVGELLVALGPS
ncbi:MAG TPA: biotin carboxylase N-terminal domain-containing protein [Acidimicrobiales bacterium]|nr:biotin carboxylase N-terminal domain-containing protein [Acidimicrobiales bacterium]